VADVTGTGLIVEAIADAMGLAPRTVIQQRVITTLRSVTGATPGFDIARNARGFLPTFFDARTGVAAPPAVQASPMSTA